MPNIEISAKGFKEGPRKIKMAIDAIVKRMGLEKEVITTIMDSTPESCDGKLTPMPFIRICATDATEVEKIVQVLRFEKLGVDIETLLLTSFISADEMR